MRAAIRPRPKIVGAQNLLTVTPVGTSRRKEKAGLSPGLIKSSNVDDIYLDVVGAYKLNTVISLQLYVKLTFAEGVWLDAI